MKIYDYNGKKNLCGLVIQRERVRKSLTQTDLSIRLKEEGITLETNSISRIEAGKRFVADYELMAISQILDIGIDSLLNKDVSVIPKKWICTLK